MRVPRRPDLSRATRRFWLRSSRGPIILVYHRVAAVSPDPWGLAVSPDQFAEHLEVVRRRAHPVTLLALAAGYRRGGLPRRAIAFTFDDGYADNLHRALPLLERYDVPATVFVTTGQVGHDREFWWDELERLFLQPGRIAGTISLSLNGRTYNWAVGNGGSYDLDASARDCEWTVDRQDDPTPRHTLYRSLYRFVRALPESERSPVLQHLRVSAHASPAGRPTHRCLSIEELRILSQSSLIEVGSHTVTHPILSSLPQARQAEEIVGSTRLLEQWLNRPVSSFAYPFGKPRDYSRATTAIVRAAGFRCACSSKAGVVWCGASRFRLPRLEIPNCDGDGFAKLLSPWLNG